MDLDDEELEATRKLKGLIDNKFEEFENLCQTYFSNCKSKNDVFNTQVLMVKKLKQIAEKRTNELKSEVI